jgi:hypothetical protein
MTTRCYASAALVAAWFIVVMPVAAGEVRVIHARCASEVQVVARDVPLSEVLKKLSTVLGFQLRFESDSDPRITIDAIERMERLHLRLGTSDNIAMMLEKDPRCPGQQRIVRMWVLPVGSGGLPRPSVAALQKDEDRARREKANVEAFMRTHGMDAEGRPLQQ